MHNVGAFLESKQKEFLEDFLNDILLEEAMIFIEKYHTILDGYIPRTLRMRYQTLNILRPTVRFHRKELNYSILPKYQRKVDDLVEFEEKLYKSRIYKRDIEKVLNLTTLSRKKRKDLIEKYYNKYLDYMTKKKEKYDILKVDATFFLKGWTVYFIFAFKGNNKKCLGYFIEKGNEGKEGWEKVIAYLVNNDFFGAKIIVSDLNNSLKAQLTESNDKILLQNCIFHRLIKLTTFIKGTFEYKKKLFAKIYLHFINCDTENILKDFEELKKETLNQRNSKGKRYDTNIDDIINYYYDDNFSYLVLDEEIQKDYKVKNVIQNMDIESIIFCIKDNLRKYRYYNNEIELTAKIFFTLEDLGLLEN